ncbi:hypothetical protein [Rhizorhabdus dicambivorans]|uniref:hypothetical protein n=1 Tax=Rhizorhabdus dicambivorans TaxID=1850238 RepID=UPI001142B7D7|nr:hypothetical protein [Rhizorhabdus dicambivorans]
MVGPQIFAQFADRYDDRIKKAVGILFLTSGAVETSLSVLLARLASHPGEINSRLAFAFSGMDVRVKLSKLCDLCVGTNVDRSQITHVTQSISKLFERRNAIAHNLCDPSGENIRILNLKIVRNGLKADQIFTADRIEKIAALMLVRSRQLDALIPK